MHVVFRSSKATGELSLLHPAKVAQVSRKVSAMARRFDVKIYEFANAGNHVHMLIRGRTRRGIQNFLRSVGSQVAQLVTGARKGHAFGKFWDALVFTRVVAPGRRAYDAARGYIHQNLMETLGLWPVARRPRAGPAHAHANE